MTHIAAGEDNQDGEQTHQSDDYGEDVQNRVHRISDEDKHFQFLRFRFFHFGRLDLAKKSESVLWLHLKSKP